MFDGSDFREMALSSYTLFVIIGCGLVTFIPRVLPFIFVRKLQLPDVVIRYLSYVPPLHSYSAIRSKFIDYKGK